MKDLTEKQERFALSYVETGNRVEAYRRSYECSKMKENTVRRKAQEVAALPHVGARIDNLHGEARERNAVTVDRTIQEFATIGFSKITDFVRLEDDGLKVRDFEELTPEQQALLYGPGLHYDGKKLDIPVIDSDGENVWLSDEKVEVFEYKK